MRRTSPIAANASESPGATLRENTQLLLVDALRRWAHPSSTSVDTWESPSWWHDLLESDPRLLSWASERRAFHAATVELTFWLAQKSPQTLIAEERLGDLCPRLHEALTDHLRDRLLRQRFDELLRQQKIEALYQLAYGLSHEINNPLANISTRAQMLLREETDSQRRHWLASIIDQTERAHEMIGDLMVFARSTPLTLRPCQVMPLIEECVESFREANKAASVEILFTPGPASEATELNLCSSTFRDLLAVVLRNAVEAIGTLGTIVITTSIQDDQFEIAIRDSGPGLSAKALLHAFDPYFSGREAGRGLGLGLSKAYRWTQQMNGRIAMENTQPRGCLVTLQFPHGR